MFPKRFSVCAMVLAVALLVAGCSSGGGKHATPTTVSATTTTTTRTTVSVVGNPGGPPTGGVDIGPCPSTPLLAASLTKLPSAVQTLRRNLVPIARVADVRICEYGGVPMRLQGNGGGMLPSVITSFEDETNRLPTTTRPEGCEQPSGAPLYVVTFANVAKRVNISEDPCGFVSNGERRAVASAKWRNELGRYTKPSPALSGVVGGPTG
jgi:hypothetical protein